jgi:hypothetical protein
MAKTSNDGKSTVMANETPDERTEVTSQEMEEAINAFGRPGYDPSIGMARGKTRLLLALESSESVWKDRAAATHSILSQIDDVTWAGLASVTGNRSYLDLARLGPDGRKLKFAAAACNTRGEQK